MSRGLGERMTVVKRSVVAVGKGGGYENTYTSEVRGRVIGVGILSLLGRILKYLLVDRLEIFCLC